MPRWKISERKICFYRAIWFSLPPEKRNRDGVIQWVLDNMRKGKSKRRHKLTHYKRIGTFFEKAPDGLIDFIVSDHNKYTHWYAFRPKVLKDDTSEGYECSILISHLKRVKLIEQFNEWMVGKHIGNIDNKAVFYKDDLMEFLEEQKHHETL